MSALKVLHFLFVFSVIKSGCAKPSNPAIKFQTFNDSISGSFLMVYDPHKISELNVECSSKDGQASFNANGNLKFFINNELQTTTQETAPNFTLIEIKMSFTMSEDLVLRCRLEHSDLSPSGFRESTITFKSSSQTIEMEKNSFTIIQKESVTLKKAKSVEIGRTRNVEYKWFERKNNSEEWTEITRETKDTLKVVARPPPEVMWYKMSFKQITYFNISAESEPVKIETYTPLSKVTINSPLHVCTEHHTEVTLRCSADAYPKAEIFWWKAGRFDAIEFDEGDVLTVGHHISDSGLYKCGAVQRFLNRTTVVESFQAVQVSVKGRQRDCEKH